MRAVSAPQSQLSTLTVQQDGVAVAGAGCHRLLMKAKGRLVSRVTG